MRNWYHSWRAAVRIARRDAWRAKGLSALVLAMLALPILGVSGADLTLRSAQLSTEEQLQRSIGAAESGHRALGAVPTHGPPSDGPVPALRVSAAAYGALAAQEPKALGREGPLHRPDARTEEAARTDNTGRAERA